MNNIVNIGLDVGSTTVKAAVLNLSGEIILQYYKRHYANIQDTVVSLFDSILSSLSNVIFTVNVTGSAGMGIAERMDIPYIQEVIACTGAVEALIPQTDIVIELGGEDAKITYFSGGVEQRMNGTCAGGTGAFIDEMASLLQTDAQGLNEMAKDYQTIRPIASRCGVFAKTDVQPLLNEGARREDIAASVFQAVVNRTISGLACGRPIRGNVAFLGGPLHYLSELRNRFIETLKLKPGQVIVPENARLFTAIGAAMASVQNKAIDSECLRMNTTKFTITKVREINGLHPLFSDTQQMNDFLDRHSQCKVKKKDILTGNEKCFLGLDSGSTTTKAVLIDEDEQLVKSYYVSNGGNPLKQAVQILQNIYNELPGINIINSAVTGYGEYLIKAALKIDTSEIETVAHFKAAQFFLPGVDCIIDIGGQDMKCIKTKDGIIDNIMLNEACSSGCGSFLETFAQSLGMDIKSFAAAALRSKAPVDLGTRCTVFMNSKVKQALKEGVAPEDISAGLSYSVIKNALQKVIKMKSTDDLGEKIIVQGGTFNNNAVLRAFEIISGKNVTRPETAAVMGAFGAALIAKQRYVEGQSTGLIGKSELKDFSFKTQTQRCKHCGNHCLLTVNIFSDGREYISGNRCEKGLRTPIDQKKPPNLYEYRYKRFFQAPLDEKEFKRGKVGIPRGLNIYENYPFWHAFFTELGFKTILSSVSSKKIYEKGLETIPAETVCYPAKLMHGHIADLIDKKCDIIFYPCIPYEEKEQKDADNCYNCPIVTSYAQVIKNNTDFSSETIFMCPYLPYHNTALLIESLSKEFKPFGISKKEIKQAVQSGRREMKSAKSDIRKKGEEVIEYLQRTGGKGIILSGRPYHIDPEINHGLDKLITGMGLAVLTEDSVAHLAKVERPLRVLDQWTYHSRLYASAEYTGQNTFLELVQLTSFGCGLDSVTADQASEILGKYGKNLTLIKIDEGSNLGAVRIRLRSLKATMDQKEYKDITPAIKKIPYKKVEFTKQMKKSHVILAPQMSSIHFNLLQEAFKSSGYDMDVLPAENPAIVEEGLKYVNNDSCYPSIIIVGQIISAIKSGKYDLHNVSVIITQTGGGCRASNYISFIRKALQDIGLPHIPVISLNASGLETHSGFVITPILAHKSMLSLVYGDLFMKMLHGSRPFEKVKGSTHILYEKWSKKALQNIRSGNLTVFNSNIKAIVNDFDNLDVTGEIKPKVGVTGEIFAKYHPLSNNNLIEFLEREGAEVFVPGIFDFLSYCAYNPKIKYNNLMCTLKKKVTSELMLNLMEIYDRKMRNGIKNSKRFMPTGKISEKAEFAEEFMSLGHQTGEGWLIPGEIAEMLSLGVENIICAQPFACLPNHISGKATFKVIKQKFPNANLVAIDYDPGASEVNQLNRIHLMLGNAKKNLTRN